MTLNLPGQSSLLPPSQDRNLITPERSLLPCKVTFIGSWEWDVDLFGVVIWLTTPMNLAWLWSKSDRPSKGHFYKGTWSAQSFRTGGSAPEPGLLSGPWEVAAGLSTEAQGWE